MKSGAIFDMDGLLFDTERFYRRAWLDAAPQFGQPPSPALAEAVCGTSGDHLKEIVRSYYPDVDADAYIQAMFHRVEELLAGKGVKLMPGARELIAYLRIHGVKLAVASASPRSMIERNLLTSGIRAEFDVIVSGSDISNGKPAPDIFLAAAAGLGLSPEDCYVFEDGVNGAMGGIAAGCPTVMIPDLEDPTSDLLRSCTGIYSSLLDVLEALKAAQL